MSDPANPSELSEAALALDRELRRFEELAALAGKIKLNTEKALERATEALTRAAESQDRIHAHVQQLVAAVAAARQKQESDAAALMARAEQISARRKEFAGLLQRMAGLGEMARSLQNALREGPSGLDDAEATMKGIADEAAAIARDAEEKEMEDVARQAEVLRQQVLAARNKVGLLARKS
jgi:hypothetical protein